MKGEINRDFYCSANCYNRNGNETGLTCTVAGVCLKCDNYRRKHPTPEQYKEEYGEEYPDDGAVYFLERLGVNKYVGKWAVTTVSELIIGKYAGIKICACTPFGKPDAGWRPE